MDPAPGSGAPARAASSITRALSPLATAAAVLAVAHVPAARSVVPGLGVFTGALGPLLVVVGVLAFVGRVAHVRPGLAPPSSWVLFAVAAVFASGVGVYYARAEVTLIAGGGGAVLRVGLTLDAPAGQLNTDPEPPAASVLDSQLATATLAVIPLDADAVVYVTQAMANNPALGILRLQWSNNGDAAPVVGTIDIPTVTLRVTRIGNLDA